MRTPLVLVLGALVAGRVLGRRPLDSPDAVRALRSARGSSLASSFAEDGRVRHLPNIARREASGQTTIPKILHLAFVPKRAGEGMPQTFHDGLESWKKTHPGWNFMQWDAESNRRLIEQHYPWFLQTYDGFDKEIKRLDAMRYVYLHRFGGIYTDMDILASKPLDASLAGSDLVVVERGGGIQNYFVASVAGHPLWLSALESIKAVSALPKVSTPNIYDDVLCAVGWEMLTSLWKQRFHARLDGSGDIEGAKYRVFSEKESHDLLGLDHKFASSWTSFVQQGTASCQDVQPGWASAIARA